MNTPTEIDDFEPDLPADCYSAEEIEELIADSLPPRHFNSGKIPAFVRRRNSLIIIASRKGN